MIDTAWQSLTTAIAPWKILAALGGSLLITAIALGVLLWIEARSTRPKP